MIPAAEGICLFALQRDAQVPQTCLPPLNPIQLQPVIRMQSGGKEQLLAVFSYSNSTQKPYQQAGSVTQVQSVMVIYCIKRKANSIRSGQVKNWSARKYQSVGTFSLAHPSWDL